MTARRPAPRCGQGGFTLLEVLVTMVISFMVAVPLLAWMIIGMKTEDVVDRESDRTQATNQLATYFPRDVASASEVVPSGVGCGGAAPTDVVVASMTIGRAGTQRVAYVVVAGSGGTQSLVRRVCGTDGSGTVESRVLDDVADGAGSVVAVCPPPTAGCPRVDLTVTTRRSGRIDVTGSRRIGADS